MAASDGLRAQREAERAAARARRSGGQPAGGLPEREIPEPMHAKKKLGSPLELVPADPPTGQQAAALADVGQPPMASDQASPPERTEPAAPASAAEEPGEIVADTTREIAAEIATDTTARPAVTTTPSVTPAKPQSTGGRSAAATLPELQVPTGPEAMIVSPTQLSARSSVVRRFEAHAKRTGLTHTAIVLDALRAHAQQLPDLVLAARPAGKSGDLFALRSIPAATATPDRPAPIRIRPVIGETAVIDQLVDWVTDELRERRPGSKKANRSEVVAAALDAFLPPEKPKRGSGQK